MSDPAGDAPIASEEDFAKLVDSLKVDPGRRAELLDLFREDHPIYTDRGAAAVVRMRGWLLLGLEPLGLPAWGLLFVLEELDSAKDPYLIAAAARVLRSFPDPQERLAEHLLGAFRNVQYHDEPVCLDQYGSYPTGDEGTTAIREILVSLQWLGARARHVLADLETLWAGGAIPLSEGDARSFSETIGILRSTPLSSREAPADCCSWLLDLGSFRAWGRGARRGSEVLSEVTFEDHLGSRVRFGDFFHGHPSVVLFFYTRCDNPLKCSLTISKLARLQKQLIDQGLAGRIRTAAISYDAEFDLPERLHRYGHDRGVLLDAHHRLLRTTEGFPALKKHFSLGVNVVESLINRHRIEVYVLDSTGRIASSFERLHWDPSEVLKSASSLLTEQQDQPVLLGGGPLESGPCPEQKETNRRSRSGFALHGVGLISSVAAALLPKCPFCWAACLSALGITSPQQAAWTPYLLPVFKGVLVIYLMVLWFRGRMQGRLTGFLCALAGAFTILVLQQELHVKGAGPVGILLTWLGSLLAFSTKRARAQRSLPT